MIVVDVGGKKEDGQKVEKNKRCYIRDDHNNRYGPY